MKTFNVLLVVALAASHFFTNVVSLSSPNYAALGPFTAFPQSDNCGLRYSTNSSSNACPVDTCPAERASCIKANNARRECKRASCSLEALTAATQKATEACRVAAQCVKSSCYSSTPPGGKAGSCKVRSYYKGLCCCAMCPHAPGAVSLDAEFTHDKGYGPSATSEGGLHVGQSVTFNGKTDLSGDVRGPAGGVVFAIYLEKLENDYNSYQIVIDGIGPQGVYVPDWNFFFWDKAGNEYMTSVWTPGRSTVGLGFNSDDPTIVRFAWPAGRT